MTMISRQGNVLVVTLVIGAALAIAIVGALKLSVSTQKAIKRGQASEQRNLVIEAIAQKAIDDLRVKYLENVGPDEGNCSLDYLLEDASTIFKKASPTVYAKGHFQIDTSKARDGSSYVFSEADPKVWIEKGQSDQWYKLVIKTQLCEVPVLGRTLFDDQVDDPGLGQAYSPACPSGHLVDTQRTRLINIASRHFARRSERRACAGLLDEEEAEEAENELAYNEPLGKILVMHNQSTRVPDCPSGYDALWSGWSYMGGFLDSGGGSPVDLSGPGSCMENLTPIPFIECTVWSCDYQSGSDRSLWLSIERFDAVKSENHNGDIASLNEARDNVSRCTVCEGTKEFIVRHSQSQNAPDCPAGWDLYYSGYSFMGGTAKDSNYDAGQDLGGTGSCLRAFVPGPLAYCDNSDCFRGDGASAWLLAEETKGDESKRNHDTPAELITNRNRIGRCSVCTK